MAERKKVSGTNGSALATYTLPPLAAMPSELRRHLEQSLHLADNLTQLTIELGIEVFKTGKTSC
jgi:hypothetical protein